METNAQVLARIAKLLRLAEGNTNEHEAAAAMAAANKLMVQHGVDQALVDAAATTLEEAVNEAVDDHYVGGERKTLERWQWPLVSALAQSHGCRAYFVKARACLDHPERTEWRVIGTSLNASAVRYLYSFATRQINELCARAMKNGMGSGATWANNFKIACASRVGERYRWANKANQMDARAQLPGTALAIVNKRGEALAIAVAALSSKKGLHSASWNKRPVDSDARTAGRAAGDRVDLGHGSARGSLGTGTAGALK